jgi:phage repressor protein C with HTH and peptisase S24 domain
VLIRMGQEAMSMYPRILPGSAVLIDRHYNSLEPYRKGQLSMYAVRKENQCTIKYVEFSGNNLILRPHNQGHPVDLIPVEEGKDYRDFIIGRVCHLAVEC